MNKLITNKQVSIIALAPLLDAAGNALVLKPKGTKGDACEVTAETAEDEIVKRVEKAGWVHVGPAGAQPQSKPASVPLKASAPPAPPAAVAPPPVAPPAPSAAVEPPPPPAPLPPPPEATQVMPSADVAALAAQTKAPEPEPMHETPPPASEPPAKVKRQK